MGTADNLSNLLAVSALVIALAVFIAWWTHGTPRPRSSATVPTPTPSISVSLVVDDVSSASRWKLQCPAQGPRTIIRIFTYRSRFGDSVSDWRHELLDAPLVLPQAQPAFLAAPVYVEGVIYDVVVGWTMNGPAGYVDGSDYLTLTP